MKLMKVFQVISIFMKNDEVKKSLSENLCDKRILYLLLSIGCLGPGGFIEILPSFYSPIFLFTLPIYPNYAH